MAKELSKAALDRIKTMSLISLTEQAGGRLLVQLGTIDPTDLVTQVTPKGPITEVEFTIRKGKAS